MKTGTFKTNERWNVLASDRARELFMQNIMPHLDDAFSLARWLAGNRVDAEDIVQDACIRALKAIETQRGDHPRAWLLAIVRNVAFTWMAKNRPKDIIFSGDAAGAEEKAAGRHEASETIPTPETELIAKSDTAQLEAAILALPPNYREVIVMRDVNGLDYRAIAEAIGAPIGTVMSRLARGRALLIAKLGAPS